VLVSPPPRRPAGPRNAGKPAKKEFYANRKKTSSEASGKGRRETSPEAESRAHEAGAAGCRARPIVGSKPLPRSEMTKKLWDYIKKNNLQDPKKRTLINADVALKAVFGGKKQVSMFEMTKLVSAHVK